MTELVHRSPGITAIFNAVEGSNENGILDLGAALGTNLSFYSKLGCHFQFENFNHVVADYSQHKISDDQALEEFLDGLAPGKKYDVVLFWDLLNFLPQHFIDRLVPKLKSALRPNALVHMINFVGSTVPATPSKFTVKDQYHLFIESADERITPLKRATTMQLLKMFPNFLMVQSYLNGEGMVPGFSEQILRFGSQSQEKGTVFSSSEAISSGLQIDKRFYSPAIQRFIPDIEQAQTLLDIGSKRNFNHDFWKKAYRTVAASDLFPVLSRYLRASGEDREQYLNNGRFFDFKDDRKFDVIVAWDLFNFCPLPLLEALGRRLTRHCKDGTHLVVMAYCGKTMPAAPQAFLVDKKGVGVAARKSKQKLRENTRRLTSSHILKAFPGFYVEQAYAFRPGMQQGLNEYLFVYKDANRLETEKRALEEEVMARRKARGERDLFPPTTDDIS